MGATAAGGVIPAISRYGRQICACIGREQNLVLFHPKLFSRFPHSDLEKITKWKEEFDHLREFYRTH
jgi:hypothetical protein